MSLDPVLQIAGLAFSAIGAISQGVAAQQAAEFNAAIARQNAEIERARARLEEESERRRSRAILGAQRAAFSRGGVTLEGTPLLVQEETATEAELDALIVRFGGQLAAQREIARARAARFGGQAALSSGLFRAGTTLLTGFSGRRSGTTGQPLTGLRSTERTVRPTALQLSGPF